jgi:hypothetical protein
MDFHENFLHSPPAAAAPTSTSSALCTTLPLFDEKKRGFVKQNIPLKYTIKFLY